MEYDFLVSKFAFKFNLYRYVLDGREMAVLALNLSADHLKAEDGIMVEPAFTVGAVQCNFNPVDT